MPAPRPVSLVDVLDDEQNTTAEGVCRVPHHTEPDIACQRPSTHLEDGAHSRDLHAAKRVWNDGEPEMWATWS